MTTALPSTNNAQMQKLEQIKREFWSCNAHLPEEQRLQLWMQAVSTGPSNASNHVAQSSLQPQIPRSMSYSAFNMTQLPTSNSGSMDRVRSAPAAVAMARSTSASATANTNRLQRCSSTSSNWQPSRDDQFSGYTFSSESASMRKQPLLEPISETSTFANDAMVEYTPEQYITNIIEPSGSPILPLSHTHNPRQLHVQLTPNAQWSPSLDDSTSPSTPSTALMTPVTQSSNAMSRQSSFNPQFLDEVSMLRVQSDSSSFCPVLSEDGSFSFPLDVQSKNISNFVDNPHFLDFTGSSSESFFNPAPVSASVSDALASSENKPCLVEDMRRSASTSSESDASYASSSSLSSRQSRRQREINAQAASRWIAPKADPSNDETESASSNAQMMQIQSEDGSSKKVGLLTKNPYVRPQHPKIPCPHCNKRPEGFRGTHELERHIQRDHAATRKGYICIDYSADKTFLAKCKHCRNRKIYGAYYNAAAHLRRTHFHPKKKGRKGKHDEKRGGIGGGNDPPMDILKQFWIREVEVGNEQIAESPESASDCAEPAVTDGTSEPTYDVDASYQTLPQSTNDVSMFVDPSQLVDYNMCMNTSESLYDTSVIYTSDFNSANGDIRNFQFDAYRTQ